jgi:hypothetical protein
MCMHMCAHVHVHLYTLKCTITNPSWPFLQTVA